MEVRDALATIAEKTFELKVDTVSLRFLNNVGYTRGLKASARVCLLVPTRLFSYIQGKKKLISLFYKVKPSGAS